MGCVYGSRIRFESPCDNLTNTTSSSASPCRQASSAPPDAVHICSTWNIFATPTTIIKPPPKPLPKPWPTPSPKPFFHHSSLTTHHCTCSQLVHSYGPVNIYSDNLYRLSSPGENRPPPQSTRQHNCCCRRMFHARRQSAGAADHTPPAGAAHTDRAILHVHRPLQCKHATRRLIFRYNGS